MKLLFLFKVWQFGKVLAVFPPIWQGTKGLITLVDLVKVYSCIERKGLMLCLWSEKEWAQPSLFLMTGQAAWRLPFCPAVLKGTVSFQGEERVFLGKER